MGHGLAPLVRDGASQENLEWIDIRPTNAVIVRDAHDGIGVIDVGRIRIAPRPTGSSNQIGLMPWSTKFTPTATASSRRWLSGK